MTGKFHSLKDEVVYRATLDGTADTVGDVQDIGWHASKLIDFYGWDYIVLEDHQGFVSVERFDFIDIDDRGYFTPVDDRWSDLCEQWSTFMENEEQ